jgi:Na+/phosphate symporter
VPKPLALALATFLLLAWIALEIFRGLQRFLEHRATNTAWLSAEPPGVLDYVPDSLRAMERFTRLLDKQAEDTQRVGEKMGKHAARLERAAKKSPQAQQRLAKRVARDINKSAVFSEKRLKLLNALVCEIDRNYTAWFAVVAPESPEAAESLRGMRDSLASNRSSTHEAIESVIGYRASVKDIEEQNIARTMNAATKRLGAALDGTVRGFKKHEQNAADAVRVLDNRLGSG